MQRKYSIKSLPGSGLLLPFYELMKLGVLAKLTLKWSLNLVKLSFGIFFLLGCLMVSLLHQLYDIPLFFVKNTHQKAANFTFCLTLPAAMFPWWFLGVQFEMKELGWNLLFMQFFCSYNFVTQVMYFGYPILIPRYSGLTKHFNSNSDEDNFWKAYFKILFIYLHIVPTNHHWPNT